MLGFAMLLLIAAPSAQAEHNAPPVAVRTSYRVKQQGGGLGVFIDEAALFYEVDAAPKRIWVVERRRRDQKLGVVSTRYDWIDGRSCPALEAVITDIGRLPPIAMAGSDTQAKGAVFDVPSVTLIGPPAGGMSEDLVLRRDVTGPVSRWWWKSEKALENCWTPRKPYVAGAYDLRSRLSTTQDEIEVMRPY